MRVPLVVVTGFLGAGKTTLVNRLLARRAERGANGKLGVIVNELGAIGIDGALLGGETAKQIELPGGCVCCVLGDELDRTLIDLVERNPELEAIVLETTGVAEPLPIAWAVHREPVAQHVRLAAVVTLVDAINFLASRSVTVAATAQVAYADVLLVTKSELAGDDQTGATVEAIHELAPRALIRRDTTEAHAEWLEQVLVDPSLERVVTSDALAAPDVHAGHDHAVGEPCGETLHGVTSIWTEVVGVVDLEELEDQLGALPASYVRIKGIARAVDERGKVAWFAVHRVGLRVSSEPLVRDPDGCSGNLGRIVALGRELDPGALAKCVRVAVQTREAS